MKIVKITKVEELPNAKHPKNIKEGAVYEGENYEPPKIGERFYVGNFSTSAVQEILSENTFKTYNSIYKWEVTR